MIPGPFQARVIDPLQMTVLPSDPWESISIDFAEVGGKYVMVLIEDYSRFPITEVVHFCQRGDS